MVKFLIEPSMERESFLLAIKKPHQMVENYLSVLGRLMKILVKKQEYECAFNDLI